MSDVRAALERLLGDIGTARARPDVLGGPELPLAAPATAEELCGVLRLAAHEGWHVVPCGLGSKLGWSAPAQHADLLLTTRRITGIVNYEPGDGTLTARAGIPMHVLRSAAAAGGHWVTPDVPRPATRTLGGVLAAAESGPDRLLFGPVRHHVLGMRVALADGTVAQSGGQLVKNVTGYDLHRLYCGSHGTLCVILEASLRLFPAPEHELWVERTLDASADPFEHAGGASAARARIVSLTLARVDPPQPDARWQLAARLFGRSEPVEAERARLLERWPDAVVTSGAEARARADAWRDRACGPEDGAWLAITCLPSSAPAVLARVDGALGGSARLLAQPGIGMLEVPLGASAPRVAELLPRLRAELAPLNARVALRDATAAELAGLDPFGEPMPGAELMHRLRAALDPRGTLAAGRFHLAT